MTGPGGGAAATLTLPGGEVAHTNAIAVLDARGAVAHQQSGLGAVAGGTVDAVARLLR